MNKTENSLSRKILSVIALVFFAVTIISYISITSLLKDTLYQLERDKADLIVKNYAPLISIHLFLGMNERVNKITNSIMKNKSVLKVTILDNNSKIISNSENNITRGMEVEEIIYTPHSKIKIGKLKIIYSTDNFDKLISKYFTLMISSLLILVLIFILLNIYIRNLLYPLKKLAKILKNYSSQTAVDIPYLNETNEIGLISNAMDISHKKSLEYSKKLQEMTHQLQNHNNLLEEKVREEVEIIKQKDKQLLYQSRLALMGEMISMIAHQWRQPLSAISATTSNLTLKLMLDDINKKEFEQDIASITKYAQHLSETIDDFRDFFIKDKSKEITTLDKIVNSTLDIIKKSIENKNIEIKHELSCDTKFQTFSNELKQTLLNLIKNAEDALLDNNIKNPQIYIKTTCTDNKMILIVKDNAGGIPDDIIDKIFDPYFSTRKGKNGTGLGLYMSKTIIEEHCTGELTVSNDENGAVFKITFHM